MNYKTIAEIYDANDRVREHLHGVVSPLGTEQLEFLPPDGEWTIANIVEHLAMVENGMMRICAKLLNEAKETGESAAGGEAVLSEKFRQAVLNAKSGKFPAPERVRPTGKLSVAESFEKMNENRAALGGLRELFETVECAAFKFPHPAFGDLTAHEWLALLGGHESKHIAQIERILERLSEQPA